MYGNGDWCGVGVVVVVWWTFLCGDGGSVVDCYRYGDVFCLAVVWWGMGVVVLVVGWWWCGVGVVVVVVIFVWWSCAVLC